MKSAYDEEMHMDRHALMQKAVYPNLFRRSSWPTGSVAAYTGPGRSDVLNAAGAHLLPALFEAPVQSQVHAIPHQRGVVGVTLVLKVQVLGKLAHQAVVCRVT